MTMQPTRRDFIRTTVLTAGAIAASTGATPTRDAKASVVSTPRRSPTRANERLQFGIIGFGVRARELHGAFLDDPEVEIIAVADVADARAAEGARLVNDRRKNGACTVVSSWTDIVGDPRIDAVIIATPDHWHAQPAIAAALAGKHVYCEKPLSLTIAEGRAIADAARATGVRFQTGSQQRSEFGYHFVRAAEAVRNHRIGTLRRVTVGVGETAKPCDLPEEPLPPGINWEQWLGQAPLRPFNSALCPIGVHTHYPQWRLFREFANGGLADMGAHHFDIAQWAMNMDASGPREIIPPTDGANTGLRFIYADGVELIHGGPTDCTFEGSEGTIECSRDHVRAFKGTDRSAVDAPALLAPVSGNEVALARNASHISDFLAAIREGRDPICTAETGHRTATICQLCNIGYAVRKPLSWDPVIERFTGEYATLGNALLTRAVRPH